MKTQTYNSNFLDPYQSFLSLKGQFPEAFFFEVQGKLSLIGLRADEVVTSDVQIFDVLEKVLLENYKPVRFPFESGGAFGCLGHELVTAIEPSLRNSGYLRKSTLDAEIKLVRDLVVFEHEKNEVHIVTDLDVKITDLRGPVNTPPLKTTIDFNTLKPHLGKDQFLEGVSKIKEHIRKGNIFQAVLSERFEKAIFQAPLDLYKNVRRLGPSAYSFYFDFHDSSFFGSSPESFLTIHDDLMTTNPIAGTRPRGHDPREDKRLEDDLNNCPKESAEHLMLVDLARNDLGRVSQTPTVEVSEFRTLLKLPTVMHLVSKVKGKKRPDKSAVDAFKACFPAGTLSGAPKIRALEILSEIETRPRGFYGGAVVAFDFGGNLESCIAIRSIEVKNSMAILRAGAGIVADSIPELEFEEIQHKLKGMMMALTALEENL